MITVAVIGIVVIVIQLIFVVATIWRIKKQMTFITLLLSNWAGKSGFYEFDVREWAQKSGLSGLL